jgi:hypothetical protein
MTGLPLPKAPIWLYGDELQLGGSQMAKMEPAPARVGEMGLVPAMVSGEVETNWSARPVSGFPRVSTAVATSGCGVFWLTTIGFAVVPGELSVMDCGGQVEKNPAEPAAFETFAETSTEPGWFAVAIELFASMVTTSEVEVVDAAPAAEYCRCPARQLMFAWLEPAPANTRAESCVV